MTSAPPVSRKSILLIDDDDLIVVSVRQSLECLGFMVDVAFDSTSAVQLMLTYSYDVVVVDPYLTGGLRQEPRMLLEEIRRLQPVARTIVLSAYAGTDLTQSVAATGVASLLHKPQPVTILSQWIAGVALGSRSRGPLEAVITLPAVREQLR